MTTAAALTVEVCDSCHTERPTGEFVPCLSKDFDGEHLCGVCRAKSIIQLSRYFGHGAANGIVGTLRDATNLARDETGQMVRENGVIVQGNWLADYYGLHAGWLYILEVDSLALASRPRREFVVAHLGDCQLGLDGTLRVGAAWRVKR